MKNPRLLLLTGHPKEKLLQILIERKANIVGLIVPQVDKYKKNCGEIINLAKKRRIPVMVTHPQKLSEAVRGLAYDVLFSCGYPFVIPKTVIEVPTYAINFHPTLLPKHRGKHLHHILTNNESESGVTAHIITEHIDGGPIVAQEKFKVSPFDTVNSLLRKSREAEIHLVQKVMETIEADGVQASPQNESEACEHFEKRTPDDSQIDPQKPLLELYHTIRACDPDLYPAFFDLEGEKVFIKVFRKDKPDDESDMI